MAPKPYTLLTIVQSESGAWNYEIRTSHKTGVTYCTCTGWQFNKRCKHLDAFKAAPEFKAGSVATAPAEDLGAVRSGKKAMTAAEALRSALAEYGVTMTLARCTTVAARVLDAAGAKVAIGPNVVASTLMLNADGIRIITLPD